jgi:hypothetical protein
MTPEETRRATRAGINDAVRDLATVIGFAFVFVLLWMHPLFGLGGGVLALVGFLLWRGLRWLLPSAWEARTSNRRFMADLREYLQQYPAISRGGGRWSSLLDRVRSERDYLNEQRRLRLEGAHPDNYGRPFDEWRALRHRTPR